MLTQKDKWLAVARLQAIVLLVGGARFELATNGLKEQNYIFMRL